MNNDLHFDGMGEAEASEALVLPQQFFADSGGAALVEGETRLVAAVLEDAVHCFQKYLLASDPKGRRLFREAEEWLMEPDTGAAFTFEYVCAARGLDPEFIRSGLRRWRARTVATGMSEYVLQVPRGGSGEERSRPVGTLELRKACGE